MGRHVQYQGVAVFGSNWSHFSIQLITGINDARVFSTVLTKGIDDAPPVFNTAHFTFAFVF